MADRWDTLVGRDLLAAVDRDRARLRAAGSADMTRRGGIGSLYLVFGVVFGLAAVVLARALSDIRWDGSTVLLATGAVAILGLGLLSALERARAASPSFAVRMGGFPVAICLGAFWLLDVGFAVGRLDMDPSSRDPRGIAGLVLVVAAVGGAVSLVVRARRAEPVLSPSVRADARARRALDDLETHFRSGRMDEARAAELIRPIRERWSRDSAPG